jgi:hypothetical protein
VDDFEPLFWATGCQAKADLATELIFLGDGAKWIWRLVDTHYPREGVWLVREQKTDIEQLEGRYSSGRLGITEWSQSAAFRFGSKSKVIPADQPNMFIAQRR